MVYLAGQSPGKLSGAREIAAAESIPIPFLWKILQSLTRKRLLRSFRGVSGGYELARAARQITLADIVKARGDMRVLDRCILGQPHCDNKHACCLHQPWKKVCRELDAMLNHNTLADLARRSPNHK